MSFRIFFTKHFVVRRKIDFCRRQPEKRDFASKQEALTISELAALHRKSDM